MLGRQEQINLKMEEVRRQQEESIERRERLLEDLENVNQLTRREAEVKEAEKEHAKRQLMAQARLLDFKEI